jgi:hypothetical protein
VCAAAAGARRELPDLAPAPGSPNEYSLSNQNK